jgi:protein phosphatase
VWVFAGASHPGQFRERNEDAYSIEERRRILVVADGLGGQAAGDAASWLAATNVPAHLRERLGSGPWNPASVSSALSAIVTALSWEMLKGSSEVLGISGAGTTVVAAVLLEEEAVVCHLGDSRAYFWLADQLYRLTRDHSLFQDLVDSGQITHAEAEAREIRSVITRFVGMAGEPKPEVTTCLIPPGGRLLLCTDGLTTEVPDSRLAELMGYDASPLELAHLLVGEALRKGGRDNITVIVAARTI